MVNFIDKQFDIGKTKQYKLSIQVSLNGFLFCISSFENKCIVLKQFDTNIDELDAIFLGNNALCKQYAKVQCVYISSKQTLVPSKLFDETKTKTYLEFLCPLFDSEIVCYKNIDKINAKSVFAVNKNAYNTIKKYQPNAEFFNQTIPLIYSAINKDETNTSVYIYENLTNIVVSKEGGELLLCNTYKTESLSDSIYFTALAITKLNIDKASDVYISGNINDMEVEEFSSFFINSYREADRRVMFNVGSEAALLLANLTKLDECE